MKIKYGAIQRVTLQPIKNKFMETQFYQFDGAYKKGAIKIQSKFEYDTMALLDDECPLIKHSSFYIKEGNKLFDIIQFNDSFSFAISKHFKTVLESNNITGWSCFPIKIDNLKEEYFAFQIKSFAGPILNLEAVNNYETENSEFDISTWDNSGIFNLEDTLLKICTEEVKNIFEKAKLSNIEISPL